MPRQSTPKSPRGRPSAPIPSSISDPPSTDLRRHRRWRRVESARDYIEGQSGAIAKALVKRAKEGDAQTGRWLLAHTAVLDEQGKELRPIAPAVDHPASDAAPINNSRIVIGVALGADFAQLNTCHPVRELPMVGQVIGEGQKPE